MVKQNGKTANVDKAMEALITLNFFKGNGEELSGNIFSILNLEKLSKHFD